VGRTHDGQSSYSVCASFNTLHVFMSKSELKTEIRGILDKYCVGELFSDEDAERINQITGWGFDKYRTSINPKYPSNEKRSRNLEHLSTAGEWEFWSWHKAIDRLDDYCKRDLDMAMRNAIRKQMDDYRNGASKECMECGTGHNLTVDHRDIPFSVLCDDFIKINPQIKTSIRSNSDGGGWFICDKNMLDAWRVEHANRATLQMLCRSCNSSKGCAPA
jgi:5-methylcytosine-specific restriction endonuclease McrA